MTTTLVSPLEAAILLLVAALLGALIGVERQWRQRMAGLRTNALVALGAASYVLFSGMIEGEVSPTRVAAQVVSGIGFLGAGVILREGINVRGLNTAATLWCSAAVGVFAGAGLPGAAALCAGVVLAVNVGLRPLVRLIDATPHGASEVERRWEVRVRCPGEREAYVRALLLHSFQGSGLHLAGVESRDIDPAPMVEVQAEVTGAPGADEALERVVGRLSLEPYISAARWRVRGEAQPGGE
jgi:putative Mg2+ transporter-C (MgtC) family protein